MYQSEVLGLPARWSGTVQLSAKLPAACHKFLQSESSSKSSLLIKFFSFSWKTTEVSGGSPVDIDLDIGVWCILGSCFTNFHVDDNLHLSRSSRISKKICKFQFNERYIWTGMLRLWMVACLSVWEKTSSIEFSLNIFINFQKFLLKRLFKTPTSSVLDYDIIIQPNRNMQQTGSFNLHVSDSLNMLNSLNFPST